MNLLEAGQVQPHNGKHIADDHVWRCSFMAEADAKSFAKELEACDLNVSQGPDSDVVVVNEFNQEVEPYCEWLQIAKWEKAVIAWKVGSDPQKLFAHEGFDPKVGSGLVFQDRRAMDDLEFVRLDGNVEVYFNKKLGKEVYIGRTTTPIEATFRTACETIKSHFRTSGQPSLTGQDKEDVQQAVDALGELIKDQPDWWQALFFQGKGLIAVGKLEEAYRSLANAFEIEKQVEPIPRELAGVCLELGEFEKAVEIGEHAAALRPDDPESLGNLALNYLLAARVDAAKQTIDAALKLRSEDPINQRPRTVDRRSPIGTTPTANVDARTSKTKQNQTAAGTGKRPEMVEVLVTASRRSFSGASQW